MLHHLGLEGGAFVTSSAPAVKQRSQAGRQAVEATAPLPPPQPTPVAAFSAQHLNFLGKVKKTGSVEFFGTHILKERNKIFNFNIPFFQAHFREFGYIYATVSID